ncbi:MAG: sulfur carrier protein ThiS adenylyltransferase ThiF [Eubacterium sp.]|nr:sulfur carrier protein ThiS adenylyltransferase ThiF [Eubacterium sp.]
MEVNITREELERAFDARFPVEIKEKMHAARVAVAGLGGLGSQIAVMLARSGVGHLHLTDFDVVDVTNLNRQMYFVEHLGRPKTEALADLLCRINPWIDLELHQMRVTEADIPELYRSYPLVCEAFDKPDQKAMLVRTLLEKCPDTTIVSGNGMAGYADADGIHTEQRFRRLYVCGDGTTDVGDGIGLMAPRVSVCAGHMANKVVQLILQ